MKKLNGVCLLLATLLVVGCLGIQARSTLLIPSMQTAWPGVRADASVGGASSTTLDLYEGFLEESNKPAIISNWPEIHTFAEIGIQMKIDDGEITIGVAGSLRERLREFDSAVQELSRRPY